MIEFASVDFQEGVDIYYAFHMSFGVAINDLVCNDHLMYVEKDGRVVPFDPKEHQVGEVEQELFKLCVYIWTKAVLSGKGHPLLVIPMGDEGGTMPPPTGWAN